MVRKALGLVAAAAALLAATPAGAEITRKKAMWGPVEYNGASQFPVYAELGVGIWQVTVPWHEVAPTRPENPRDPADPAYLWPQHVTTAVEEGRRHGIEVMVLLIGAPRWANGDKPWRYAPRRPADFADFAEAADRRWPDVRHWMIWSEPTKAQNFQPLAPDNGKPLRVEVKLRGPRLYARILDAAYGRLKRRSRSNLVIGGNTYTVGAVAPRRFIDALELPSGRPPRMDLWGHNPFSLREPDLSRPPLGNGYADFSDLDTLLRWLDRAMRRATLRSQRRLRIYMSEYSLPTDHANHELNFWVTRETQADWLTKALRITRRHPRLYTFGYLGLYDDPPRRGGDQVDRGLIQLDGTRKPGFAAFRDG